MARRPLSLLSNLSSFSKLLKLLCFLWCAFSFNTGWASPHTPVEVDIYVSSSCPHCQAAYHYFKEYQKTHPDIQFHFRWIDTSRTALRQFKKQLDTLHSIDFGVPSFFFCHTRWKGFSPTIQNDLTQAIQFCKTQLKQAQFTDDIDDIKPVLQKKINHLHFAYLLQFLFASQLLAPITALINLTFPCSLFFLLGLSAITLLQPSARARYFMGGLWIIGFNVASLLYFFIPLESTWLASPLISVPLGIGILMLVFSALRENSLVVPLSWGCSILGGFLVGLYQQTCTFNMTAFSFSTAAFYSLSYLGLPVAWLALITHFCRYRSLGTFIGLFILGAIALLLLIDPIFLASMRFSIACLTSCIILGILTHKHLQRTTRS